MNSQNSIYRDPGHSSSCHTGHFSPRHPERQRGIYKRIAATLFSLLFSAGGLLAQTPEGQQMLAVDGDAVTFMRMGVAMLALILVLAIYIAALLMAKDPSKLSFGALFDNVTGQDSKDEMLDHSYDGIRELDNPMPAWLSGFFYMCIAFGFVYLLWYHVFSVGQLQAEEYASEMQAAEALYAGVELPDEAIVELTDPAKLAAGKAKFVELCAVCHLEDGGGKVGPNLTDEYWLHGGSIQDIYKTITNGVPAKGMISWTSFLNSRQRLEVASYIRTLQGTTPASPKEPQGDKWTEEDGATGEKAPPADSTGADSTAADMP